MEDIYKENVKSLKNGLEKDMGKQNVFPCFWVSRVNIMKMTLLQKAFDRVMESKQKCPQHSSQKQDKKTKIHMKTEVSGKPKKPKNPKQDKTNKN